MPNRVHVRGPRALRRQLTPLVAAALLIATLPERALAQDAVIEDASAEDASPADVAEDPSADESGDAAADTAELPVAPPAEGGVPADFDPAASDQRPVFLVTEIVVEEGVGISGEAARDALAGRFGRLRDKLDVRSLSEVKATLDQQGLNQLLGGEGAGLEKLGAYVDADRVVFGRIHKVGGVTEVGVRVFNVKEGVMEMAMSRRVKAGAPESLVLSVVDSLADRLTVWALNSYGDAAPSSQFAAMKNKKLGKGGPDASSDEGGRWSALGIGGSAIAGLGLGAVAVGATMVSADPLHDALVPSIVMGAGAVTFLGGVGLVVFDGIE